MIGQDEIGSLYTFEHRPRRAKPGTYGPLWQPTPTVAVSGSRDLGVGKAFFAATFVTLANLDGQANPPAPARERAAARRVVWRRATRPARPRPGRQPPRCYPAHAHT